MITKNNRFILILALIVFFSIIMYNLPDEDQQAPPSLVDTLQPTEVIPVGKLPTTVLPTHYRLELAVDPDKLKFAGIASININIKQSVEQIWLHGKNLEVSETYLTLNEGQRIDAQFQQIDETGVAKIVLKQAVGPGTAQVVLHYRAPFNTQLEGLYKIKEGANSYAFTQFEATSARLAFPGFDEPLFKTPYDISLTVKQDHEAISNTPVISEKLLDNGMKKVTFATTKPLPSYLIAFAVGPLDVVEWAAIPKSPVRDREIPLRGIATKGKGAKLNYALENTAAMVSALEDYFGTAYPYEKLDILAAPDFAAGAMENAGLILYREQLLLLDENSTLSAKRRYAAVHAHELSHQWFGNLVTMPWWDDIWLNEAFATWMTYVALHKWQPDKHYDEILTVRSIGAMALDSLVSTRQIRQPIESHHDIATAFDGITYRKGAGVLAMFESFLGKETFQAGIQHHLQKFAYGSATSDDFMQSLTEKSSNTLLQSAFNSFLQQPGVPTVSVDWSCQADTTQVQLTQKRYLPMGSSGSAEQTWQIPMCLVYGQQGQRSQHCLILDKPSQSFALPGTCPAYIMPNSGGAGYYRWSLSKPNWRALIDDFDLLTMQEALSAEDSLASAYRAGEIGINVYLNAIPKFVASPYQQVVVAPMTTLKFIQNHLTTLEQAPQMQNYLQNLYLPQYQALGLSENTVADLKDPVNTSLLRNEVVKFLSHDAKLPQLRARLLELGKQYIGFNGDGALHPELVASYLVTPSLTVAVQQLGQAYVQALIKLLKQSNDGTFRNHVLLALARVTEPGLAKQVRALALDKSIRTNEVFTLIGVHSRQAQNREATWHWLKQNFQKLMERVPSNAQGSIALLANRFCNETKAGKVEAFFADKIENMRGGPRRLANTLESIKLCAALAKTQRANSQAFFSRL